MKKTLALLAALLMLSPCLPAIAESVLYVSSVENLPDDFLMGMDVSSVLALEKCGVRYTDETGTEKDLFQILSESGVNAVRVRVWNDPYDENGNGYGGGNCDIDTAVEIGSRAAQYGIKLLVDFHYSDFWADPSKQQVPKAWVGMKIAEKEEALYAYTLECLTKLRQGGAQVAMVQLGNETNGKFCGEKIWMNIFKLMRGGARAVREFDPSVLIAVHFANPESAGSYMTYASKLDYYNLDYDVFASSYYPYWHGTLENLKSVLSEVQMTYGKRVMVAETSYAYTVNDTDFSGNTIGEGGSYEKPYPMTVQGQTNALTDVIQAMADIGGLGVFYWEGAWIAAGGNSYEENHAMWEKYGAGWASSYAAAYDPNDAGQHYGGCACDNQAMFDETGCALPSLQAFRLCREGQMAPMTADALEEENLSIDLAGEIQLPDTVNAVMNDNSRTALPVIWEAYDGAAMKAGGVAKYTVHGIAQGMPAVCNISMILYNFIHNGDFDGADADVWTVQDSGISSQLYIEEKKSDSLSGTKHYHFYSPGANAVDFSLEQTVLDLPAGTYRYEISIMGGDGGETDIYSYVKINGEMQYKQESHITSYNNWDTPVITGIRVEADDEVTVGIYVKCAGTGAWGKIDDAKLNSEKQ